MANHFIAAACIAATFAVPAGAQKPAVKTDTTARTTEAAADTDYQTVDMQEFEARRKLGAGYFLTGAQIRRDRGRALGDIITAHIPGLRTMYGTHLNSQYLISLRGEGPNALATNGGGASLCYVQIFVDGSYIVDGDISWISPTNIAGLEFYDATLVPPAFRRPDGQCGVLLVWSRTGG
jgi:hypothetical protein